MASQWSKTATTVCPTIGSQPLTDREALLDDPEISAVYIPLPNGLHYEWTLKALAKGKHVLLEKPSVSNTEEAESLFQSPLLSQPTGPVLMEAFHSRFSPAWALFKSTLDQPNIAHILAKAAIPSFIIKDDDIRFKYDLGGGGLMDLGTYPVMALRETFGTEPTECVDAKLTKMAPPQDQCDHTFYAKVTFPNGGVGEVDGTLRASNVSFSLPSVTVTHKPVPAPEEEKEGVKATRTRKVIFYNFMLSPHYHRIDVEDEFEVTSSKSVRKFTRKESKKAYTFKEMDVDHPGEVYWSTYRHMLEQFVNKVKGREGTGKFISHADSIAQAKALDMIYEKSGLGVRPTSKYRVV